MNTMNEQAKRIPTVRDLARLAGVSIGTVSRVLNDAENIDPEIRRRTLEIIKGSGYELTARGRRPGHSPRSVPASVFKKGARNILVLSPEMSPEWSGHELWTNFMSGVGKACEERAYSYLVNLSESFQESMEKLSGPGRIACGAIVKIGSAPPPELRAPSAAVPLVGFGAHCGNCRIPQISIDDYETGASAARALLGLGHRRIAFVNTSFTSVNFQHRLQGYVSAMKAAGAYAPELAMEIDVGQLGQAPQSSPPDMRETLERILKAQASAAIICNDWGAFGLYKACQEAKVKIPDELSVMGVDDSKLCKVVSPELSSMAIPFADIAYFAACTLIDMIEGASQHLRGRASVQYIPASPVVRDSLKPLLQGAAR